MSDKITLGEYLQAIIDSGKAAGKTPVEVRDAMVRALDGAIESLETDDGVWTADDITELLPDTQKTL